MTRSIRGGLKSNTCTSCGRNLQEVLDETQNRMLATGRLKLYDEWPTYPQVVDIRWCSLCLPIITRQIAGAVVAKEHQGSTSPGGSEAHDAGLDAGA